MRAAIVGVFMALALGACANKPEVWINPQASEEQATRDRAECRAHQRKETNRAYSSDPFAGGYGGLNTGRRVNEPVSFSAIDARRAGEKAFRDCMRLRGYVARHP